MPVATFTDVHPGKVYGTADVCELMRVCDETVAAWVKAGRLKELPRVGPRSPRRFIGAEVLKLAGGQVPVAAETKTQRARRAKAGWARALA